MDTPSLRRVDTFFEKQSQFGRYRLPTIVVFVAGLAMAMQSIALYYGIGSSRNALSNAVTVSFVADLAEPFLLWMLFAGAFYVLAKLLGGRARIGRLFKLTGWGFAPFALFGILRAVGTYYAVQGKTIPDSVRPGVIGSEQEGYHAVMAQSSGDPVLVATTAIGCLFFLVSGYFWVLAVDESTNLNRRQVRIVVVIPLLVYTAYALLQVV